jgi:hypothetical protein
VPAGFRPAFWKETSASVVMVGSIFLALGGRKRADSGPMEGPSAPSCRPWRGRQAKKPHRGRRQGDIVAGCADIG